ncbi:MAG: hypothetical protein J6386_02540 [Candidatus Synoicihabitans palmerolidicus]|nr:hypothetical protein [Candidatus Synoicihabitans palmerolidicus]
MFVASNGALTAGRRDAEGALFPYQTVDRIYDNAGLIGPVTVLAVASPSGKILWEPFAPHQSHLPAITRRLYKSIEGDRLWFEEEHRDLGLIFSYGWSTADTHGFIRRCSLQNCTHSHVRVRVLDGLRNLLPSDTSQRLQSTSSNLVDAYKVARRSTDSPFAVFSLSATIIDRAEPMETLHAAIVWSRGLPGASVLLTDRQIPAFRAGVDPVNEPHCRGLRHAYLLATHLEIPPQTTEEWCFVADTKLSQSAIVAHQQQADDAQAATILAAAEVTATEQLRRLVGSADGVQTTGDETASAHHFANTLFNVMRGGTFLDGHHLPGADFSAYVSTHNRAVATRHKTLLSSLPARLSRAELLTLISPLDDIDLTCIATEYLPLSFSRRHGDPSRPWNRFRIRILDTQGRGLLAYEGNWRDILQNWEALCLSYPDFLPAVIAKFFNASTAHGYNPYRITRTGIEWEAPESDDPWASIGYWGDHQVVYLLKLLEWSHRFHPDYLPTLLHTPAFASADVPYQLADYAALLRNPRETITFTEDHHRATLTCVDEIGADARLLSVASITSTSPKSSPSSCSSASPTSSPEAASG